MTIVLDKPTLRASALAARATVDAETAQAFAARLATTGANLVDESGATVASAYWAIGHEVETGPLLTALDAAGRAVALPVTGKGGTPLVFRRWTATLPMVAGRMGIMEPAPDAEVLEPDLLFVPLAAFDRTGHRIGYGAGFYDRSLAALRAKKTILAVGVAYAVQEMPRIPHDAHDEPLDLILTERELIRVRA